MWLWQEAVEELQEAQLAMVAKLAPSMEQALMAQEQARSEEGALWQLEAP